MESTVAISSTGASASNCDSDEGLPLPACLFGESLKAEEAACDTADLSLLQVRAGPARKFPGIGALARGIQSATSEVFGRVGSASKTARVCGFTEAKSAAKVPSGKVRSYDGEITAEGCLHWCLGESMCRSAVFEPDSSSCHVLPEFYGKGDKRMLVTDSGAVVADKTCETKCPKKDKSHKQCDEKCSFKDPVMLESFKGSVPLEHRKSVIELHTCQEACQDRSECRAVLFGHDSANCYLLSSSNDADISHYFSSGDAVISKKKVCETTISANSSDDTEKLHVEESEDSEGADEMSVLSSATDSDASFDSSEFEKFENDKDTDDDLIDIVSEKDETNKVETSKHATSGKDDDDLSFDVASESASTLSFPST